MSFLTLAIRRVGALAACAATVFGTAGIGSAHAAPADPVAASCVYTLSAPHLVDVSGQKMVTATLTSLPCTGDILPNLQTVCVELRGSGVPPKCSTQYGYVSPQVFFTPYRPGATYVSTGTGCGSTGPNLDSLCATQGPTAATL